MSPWLVPVALVFGLVVGVGVTVLVVAAHRRGARAVAVASPPLPEGVDEMIDVIANPDDKDDPWYYLRRWTTTEITALGVTQQRVREEFYPALGYRPLARRLDDIAYGAGLWAGALRGRSVTCLLPRRPGEQAGQNTGQKTGQGGTSPNG